MDIINDYEKNKKEEAARKKKLKAQRDKLMKDK